MPTYVAFLRAINLGKTRKFPMAELRGCLTEAGFEDVETHIQTGNVRLESDLPTVAEVEAELERLFEACVGFEVPTIVFTPDELARTYAAATALDVSAQRRYLTLLKTEPDPAGVEAIDAWTAPGEGARVLGRAVYWWLDHPTAAAKLSNTRLEKNTGVATTRDLKVIAKLVEKWCP